MHPAKTKTIDMKTIIVPVDFSTSSINCAHYAMQMLTDTADISLVLFHVYEKEADAEEAWYLLEKLKNGLADNGTAKVICHAEQGDDFTENLVRYARHRSAQLIVMAQNEKKKMEQIFYSSNTLKVVEKNPCPVMITPPAVYFGSIKNVALTSDFKDVDLTIPTAPLKAVLDLFRPNLHIVNVNSDHYVSLTEEFLAQRSKLAEMFKDYHPEFYFIGTFDFHDTINQFVADKQIDMVITIPRSRSFLENLFKSSNTKKLVFESTVPVLAAHE